MRAEVESPFRTFRIGLLSFFLISASIATLVATSQLIGSIGNAPSAMPLADTIQTFGIDIGATPLPAAADVPPDATMLLNRSYSTEFKASRHGCAGDTCMPRGLQTPNHLHSAVAAAPPPFASFCPNLSHQRRSIWSARHRLMPFSHHSPLTMHRCHAPRMDA